MTALRDLTGQKFGLLIVLGRASNDKQGGPCWHCVCECGTKKEIRGGDLRSGNTISCGCWKIQRITKHGHALQRSPEYRAWQDMKSRCLNPENKRYKDYGGRGIKIRQPWIDSFEAFFAYVGPRPSSRHSLHRIDNDGNYEPGNVIWALPDMQ